MTVFDRLASTLNRRDEAPNQQLAGEIAGLAPMSRKMSLRTASRLMADDFSFTNIAP